MAEIKWIKMSVDIFNNRKIRQIENMPNGDGIIAIWLKILCLAGTVNDSGMIYLTRDIPYNESTLATEFNRPLPLIQLALSTFQQFGMIDIVNNFIMISNWERYQNTEVMDKVREQTRIRTAEYRKRLSAKRDVTCDATVTLRDDTDKEVDKELEVDKEMSNSADKPRRSVKPKFIPPTLEEVKAYIDEKKYNVNAQTFFDYFTTGNWIDKNGVPVSNWKQKVITWSGRSPAKIDEKPKPQAIEAHIDGTITRPKQRKIILDENNDFLRWEDE